MEHTNNYKYFEDYFPALNALQREDKFFESIHMVEDIGI